MFLPSKTDKNSDTDESGTVILSEKILPAVGPLPYFAKTDEDPITSWITIFNFFEENFK